MEKVFAETIHLLDNSSFYYVITTNMEGVYSYVNKNYLNTFADIHGQIVGQPYYITMHPEDTKVCEEVAAKCLKHPTALFPATIRKHDGKGGYIITQWEYQAMFNDDGSPEGIFCLGYDITTFMKERSELQTSQSDLEETKEILERKKQALKEVMFDQSHVIRRPVANIIGLIHILQKMEVDQNLKNIVDMLLISTNELDDVIKRIVTKAYE